MVFTSVTSLYQNNIISIDITTYATVLRPISVNPSLIDYNMSHRNVPDEFFAL